MRKKNRLCWKIPVGLSQEASRAEGSVADPLFLQEPEYSHTGSCTLMRVSLALFLQGGNSGTESLA